MIKAALGYITHRKLDQVPCRLDVVTISEASEHEIELTQNAFEMDRARM